MSEKTWKAGIKEMERIQREVEGEDDRSYSNDMEQKKMK